MIFQAADPPEAPSQDVLQAIRDIEQPPPRPTSGPARMPGGPVRVAPSVAVPPDGKRGPRPPEDRDAFNLEVGRRLALDGGNVRRTQFLTEMKQWAANKLEPVPDDRTIERWFNRIVDRGVLPE
jgi:hypothetical protein